MKKVALLLICFALAACATAEDESKEAGKKLPAWNGQDITVAVSALGRPDYVRSGPKGSLNVWIGKRQIRTSMLTITDAQTGAQTTHFDPNPDHTMTAPCTLKIVTDTDNVIQKSILKGTPLGCQPFAEKINAAIPQ